jgi:hypothetical protein
VEGVIKIKMETLCVDSTAVKVHPDGAGALKKLESRPLEDHGEAHDKNSYGHRV